MSSSSVDGLSARLCTICLNSVLDDNSRGKAELVCGHLFHLDCIGSEFNYRSEMKCPNCRVVENGEWLIPDEDPDDDDDYSVHVVNNRRLELHIYSHGGRGSSPTSRGQNGDQEPRLSMISPTVHYHHNTVVLPPSYGGSASVGYSNDSLSADSLLRAYGGPQSSDSTRSTRVEHVVLQDRSNSRPNVGEVRSHYQRTRYHHNSPTPTTVDNASMHQRRDENTHVHANTTRFESFSPYGYYNDPSLELTLTTNPSEGRSQEEQHQTHEGTTQSTNERDESYWFQGNGTLTTLKLVNLNV